MKLKTTGALAAVALTMLTLTACGDDSSSSSTEKITIGIKFDQPGMGLKEGTGYTGFDVDVAKYVAKELGYSADQITFKEAPSVQRETLISAGQVKFIVGTYSITDARKEKVSFAGPYFIAGQSLLVRSDSDIKTKENLVGKKLCSVNGSTSATKVNELLGNKAQLQTYDTYSKCVAALAAKAVDAVTTDNTILSGFAAQEQYRGKLKVVGEPFSEERYGIGLTKGDTAFCGKVNAALQKMVTDGSWKKALDANIGPSGFVPTAANPPKPDTCS